MYKILKSSPDIDIYANFNLYHPKPKYLICAFRLGFTKGWATI